MLDVPHTTGNHTPQRFCSSRSEALDVPHTIGNHTPAFLRRFIR